MPLPFIQIESFRAFRDRTIELELRPLTMLYGRNQVGKSTLLRLLPLLADSMFGSVPAFDLESPALMGANFRELGWRGPEPSPSPKLRIGVPGTDAFLELQLVDEGGLVPNRVVVGTGTNTRFNVSRDGEVTRVGAALSIPYAGMIDGRTWSGELKFASLLPSGVPKYAQVRLTRIEKAFEPFERIQWLASSAPGDRASRCCRPNGGDLAEILHDNPLVLAAASDWLQTQGIDEVVSVVQNPRGDRELHLRRGVGDQLPLYLAGEGMRWLLPMLLTTCWAEQVDGGGPTMLAIEEPESRLHPHLQVAMFDRLREISATVPTVLETHSVYMLRAMQLAVAQGKLDPQDVALYWVDRTADGLAATVVPIEVGKDGTLNGWQPDTFEEEQQLSRAIFEARWGSRAEP